MWFVQIKLEPWRRMKWLLPTYLLRMACVLRYSIDFFFFNRIPFQKFWCLVFLTILVSLEGLQVSSWAFSVLCGSPKSWSRSSCAVQKRWSPSTPLFQSPLHPSVTRLWMPKWRCFSGFPLWPWSWNGAADSPTCSVPCFLPQPVSLLCSPYTKYIDFMVLSVWQNSSYWRTFAAVVTT